MQHLKVRIGESERGASMIEYVIATVILVTVFVGAIGAFESAAKSRSEVSSETVQGMVPCVGGNLGGSIGGDDVCR